jgi:DNA end-binding protein Ku
VTAVGFSEGLRAAMGRDELARKLGEKIVARAIWSGVLTFGLVSVSVELYSATEAHGPVFHQ